MEINKIKIGIIGLGYVGLPLAIEFAKKNKVIGFDIDSQRINALKKNLDKTLEVGQSELAQSTLSYTEKINELGDCSVFIRFVSSFKMLV